MERGIMKKILRLTLMLGMLLQLGISLASPVELHAQQAAQTLMGYATGPDVLHVLDLGDFRQTTRLFSSEPQTSLTSSPKFGPNKRLYIADSNAKELHVIDLETNQFLDDQVISLPGEPNDFEITGSSAIVTDFSGKKLQVVDLTTGKITQEIAVNGPAANEIAITPNSRRAYVTTYDYTEAIPHKISHPLVAFDIVQTGSSLQLLAGTTVPLQQTINGQVIPFMASSVDVSSDGALVYVLGIDDYEEEPTIFVLDAATLKVQKTLPVDLGSRARSPLVNTMVLSPDDHAIGIAGFTNGLALLDVQTGKTRILFPNGNQLIATSTFGVSFGADGKTVYATGNRGLPFGFMAAFDVATGNQTGVITFTGQPLLYMAIPGGKTF
jgi:DNA-binding beta-propeller fold protein YncE